MSTTPSTAEARSSRRWLALGVIAAAQFMVIMDTSIIGVALPEMQHDLGFTPEGLSWVFNAYVVAFGGLLLLGGRLSDLFGARRIFSIGWVVLAAGSLMAGFAGNVPVELAGRAVQGAGSALIAPAALTLLFMTFGSSPKELDQGVGAVRCRGTRRRHRRCLPRRRPDRVRLLALGVLHQRPPGRRRAGGDPFGAARRRDPPRLPGPHQRRHRHRRARSGRVRRGPRPAGGMDLSVDADSPDSVGWRCWGCSWPGRRGCGSR